MPDSPSAQSSRLANTLRKADQQLGYAVEAENETLAGPYLRGAIGMLILAVELQGEEIALLRESVRAAHSGIGALDARTIGLQVLG